MNLTVPRARPKALFLVFAALLLALGGAPSGRCAALDTPFSPGNAISADMNFGEQWHFQTTVKQQHDFSCGAAALATLLIYHYEEPVTAEEVFEGMFEAADKEKIRAQGFSMLDMKNYLETSGYDSAGYEVTLEKVAAMRLPAIVLLSLGGYNHFVVVKGISETDVLIGDPATGLRSLPRNQFEAMWNGMIFIVRDNMEVAKRNFNREKEWKARPVAVAEAPFFKSGN